MLKFFLRPLGLGFITNFPITMSVIRNCLLSGTFLKLAHRGSEWVKSAVKPIGNPLFLKIRGLISGLIPWINLPFLKEELKFLFLGPAMLRARF